MTRPHIDLSACDDAASLPCGHTVEQNEGNALKRRRLDSGEWTDHLWCQTCGRFQPLPVRHDLEIRESGDDRFRRSACTCGWESDKWHKRGLDMTRRWLRTEHASHCFQVREAS